MSRYRIDCNECGDELGSTDDPRDAYDIARRTANEGHDAGITARGLVNRIRYDRANRDRTS